MSKICKDEMSSKEKLSPWKIPLYKMYHDKQDIDGVLAVLKRGMFWGLSKETIQLEKQLAKYVGVKYCLVFNSGTSALHASLIAHKLKKGNEIIVPSFTFIATANSTLFVDAVPKFSDIELDSFGLDPSLLGKKINSRTKAIIPVHYAGGMCKISEIKEIANQKKILVIEDAAESLGSKLKNKMAGSFGDSAILSFAWNKVITSGEGGAVLTDSKEVYERLILVRSHGRVDKENYFMSSRSPEYVSLGYNWRMSAITAALGLTQLNKIDKLLKMRETNSHYLSQKLAKMKFLEIPKSLPKSTHSYMMYTIRLEGRKIRDSLQDFLTKKKIQTKINFEPIHLTRFYSQKFGYKKGDLKNTENIAQSVLTLPMYPNLKKNEMDYIRNCIEEFAVKNDLL
jgi:perosamine synthetase